MPMSIKVVDSSGSVAWIQNEPATPAFEKFLGEACAGSIMLTLSWRNVAETCYTLAKRNSPEIAEAFLIRLPTVAVRIIAGEILRCATVRVDWIGA